MQILKKIIAIGLSVALCSYTQIVASQPTGLIKEPQNNYRFDFVETQSPWLTSLNPAGLADFNLHNISFGSITLTKENGEHKNYFESNNSFNFQATCKSLYRFNDKIVAKGIVGYSNFTGQNMSGSVFINPYERPFDILDFDTSTQGKKRLELYTISGAISAKVCNNLEVGGEIDFNSANYAKMKDLRYKTSYSNLKTTASLRYSPISNLYIGGGYTFSQEIEGIAFSFYGAENILYSELISFGGFWGISSTYSELSHNFIKSTRQPFIELSHRASAQLSYSISNLTIMLEGYYKSAKGSYGLENPSSVVHTKNNNTEYGVNAQLLYSTSKNRHHFGLNLQNTKMENYRTVWREQSTGGGNSEVVYFDPVKAGDNSKLNYQITYTGDFMIEELTPHWQLCAWFEKYHRNTFATIYPYYNTQKITTYSTYAKILRNIKWKKNTLAIAIGGGFQWGSGTISEEETYTTPSQDMNPPKTSNTMMQKEWDFLTAKQYKITPMLRYSYLIGKKNEIYSEINYNFINAYELDTKSKHTLMISIGCNF